MSTWREHARDLKVGNRIELLMPLGERWPVGTVLTVEHQELNEMSNSLVLVNNDDDRQDVIMGPPLDDEDWDKECVLFKVVEYAQNG